MQETADVEAPPAYDEFAHLVSRFDAVATPGADVPFALDHALLTLAKIDRRERLSEHRCDRLIGAITRARAAARIRLPPAYSRRRLDEGLVAAVGIVLDWTDCKRRRSRRRPNFYMDLAGYARILRNDMHNMCIAEAIADRHRESQTGALDVVVELLAGRREG